MSIIHDALKKVEQESKRETSQTPVPVSTPPLQPAADRTPSTPAGHSWSFPAFSLRNNLLGVDIGSSSIKIIKLKSSGRDCRITAAGYLKINADTDRQGVSEALKKILSANRIRPGRVASSIADKSLTFSHIILPKMPETDLKEAVRWEVRKGIDFPDDAVIDYIVNSEVAEEGRTTLSILAFAVRREEVVSQAEILKKASLIPEAIDVGPMALLSAFDHNYQGERDKRYAILDIGASKSTLSIIFNGTLRLTRYIPLAGNDLTRLIQDAEGISFQEAEARKIRFASSVNEAPESVRSAVNSFMEGISTELRRSFNYYQAQLREGWVDALLLSGGSAGIGGLSQYIESNLGVATSVYDTMKNVEMKKNTPGYIDLSHHPAIFTEAFGLALRREG